MEVEEMFAYAPTLLYIKTYIEPLLTFYACRKDDLTRFLLLGFPSYEKELVKSPAKPFIVQQP
jgi:hypothetical protein